MLRSRPSTRAAGGLLDAGLLHGRDRSAPNARAVRLTPTTSSRRCIDLGAGSSAAASPPSPTGTSRPCSGTTRAIGSTCTVRSGRRDGLDDRARQHRQPPDRLRHRREPPGVRRRSATAPTTTCTRIGARGRHAEVRRRREGAKTTQWGWGCSHSMSNLLSYHPQAASFCRLRDRLLPGHRQRRLRCREHRRHLHRQPQQGDGRRCRLQRQRGGRARRRGDRARRLEDGLQRAPGADRRWDRRRTQGDDEPGHRLRAIARTTRLRRVVWLTTTAGVDEADSAIARWQPEGDSAEQYLVGWMEPTAAAYKLARIDAAGAFLEGPTDVAARARWGQRDDPFRVHANGDIVWALVRRGRRDDVARRAPALRRQRAVCRVLKTTARARQNENASRIATAVRRPGRWRRPARRAVADDGGAHAVAGRPHRRERAPGVGHRIVASVSGNTRIGFDRDGCPRRRRR